MAFHNSFVKWAYDRYIKEPDPPIPLYERFTTEECSTLYRLLDKSGKTVTEIDAVRQIARDERTSISDVWKSRSRYFLDESQPEPDLPSLPSSSENN